MTQFKEAKIPGGDLITYCDGALVIGDHPAIKVLRGDRIGVKPISEFGAKCLVRKAIKDACPFPGGTPLRLRPRSRSRSRHRPPARLRRAPQRPCGLPLTGFL